MAISRRQGNDDKVGESANGRAERTPPVYAFLTPLRSQSQLATDGSTASNEQGRPSQADRSSLGWRSRPRRLNFGFAELAVSLLCSRQTNFSVGVCALGLFEKLRHEFIDIIEWIDDSRHALVWRFPRYQNEIKNGAQLIVRPGQAAVFVHRGEIADVFEPGHYELKTDNLPLLSTIAGWKHGFNSPFKAEVYFVSTKQITDLKWGTPNPIMMRDPEFGPIRIRAFGTYALKVVSPRALLEELVGTDKVVNAEEVTELLRSIIISTFADVLGNANVAALDLASKYQEFGETLRLAV